MLNESEIHIRCAPARIVTCILETPLLVHLYVDPVLEQVDQTTRSMQLRFNLLL
jgi:hypothetical protein